MIVLSTFLSLFLQVIDQNLRKWSWWAIKLHTWERARNLFDDHLSLMYSKIVFFEILWCEWYVKRYWGEIEMKWEREVKNESERIFRLPLYLVSMNMIMTHVSSSLSVGKGLHDSYFDGFHFLSQLISLLYRMIVQWYVPHCYYVLGTGGGGVRIPTMEEWKMMKKEVKKERRRWNE